MHVLITVSVADKGEFENKVWLNMGRVNVASLNMAGSNITRHGEVEDGNIVHNYIEQDYT